MANTGDRKKNHVRKILVSVSVFACNSGAGNGNANFMGAWKHAFPLQETCVPSAGKTHAHKILRFRGGVFGFFLGGGECRFYFYGHEDFSDHDSQRRDRICMTPLGRTLFCNPDKIRESANSALVTML